MLTVHLEVLGFLACLGLHVNEVCLRIFLFSISLNFSSVRHMVTDAYAVVLTDSYITFTMPHSALSDTYAGKRRVCRFVSTTTCGLECIVKG